MLNQTQIKILKNIFLLVDISFLIYWVINFFHLIPNEYLFSDYKNTLVVNWNWSFLPIDLLISVTGLSSLYLEKSGYPNWLYLALISLTLTTASGLMAISYWVFKGEFNVLWWIPNLFLLLYPLYFIKKIVLS